MPTDPTELSYGSDEWLALIFLRHGQATSAELAEYAQWQISEAQQAISTLIGMKLATQITTEPPIYTLTLDGSRRAAAIANQLQSKEQAQ